MRLQSAEEESDRVVLKRQMFGERLKNDEKEQILMISSVNDVMSRAEIFTAKRKELKITSGFVPEMQDNVFWIMRFKYFGRVSFIRVFS